MNISKYIAFAAVATAATGAFAIGADNAMIQFETTADYYADGTPVKDGEWYALCWSPDGVFEGITTDYKPLDAANDKVFMLRPKAKNGKCPLTIFQLENAPTTGKYCVILLDTRDADGNPAADNEDRIPTRASNAAIASGSYTVSSSESGAGSSIGEQTAVATAGWDKTIDPATATTAKIVGIEVKDAKIVITVDGAMEGVRYNLKSGDTPTTVETYEKPVKATKTTGQEIPVEKTGDDAKFYKLTHEPATR